MNEDLDILEKEILLAIFRCSAFDFHTIKKVYQELKSYDETIKALEMRMSINKPISDITESIKKAKSLINKKKI